MSAAAEQTAPADEPVRTPKPERPRRTRALIAERHRCVPRDVRVLGPTKWIWQGGTSVLVLVRVEGEHEPLWIARERLLDGGEEVGPGAEDERPPLNRGHEPRLPGGRC